MELIIIIFIVLLCVWGIFCYDIGNKKGYSRTCHIVEENNNEILQARKQIENEIQLEKSNLEYLQEQCTKQQSVISDNLKNYEELEKQKVLQNLDSFKTKIEQDKDKYLEEIVELSQELDKICRQKAATIENIQREKVVQQNEDDYRIVIPKEELNDIEILNSFKDRLSNPEVLSKLIWSNYYQKRAKELFLKTFNQRKVCGIYKITNINTNMCYIGQSVDIEKRFYQHCKCGCGIKNPKNNKLYDSMLEDNLSSFTFEIVEECPKEELNEKETFYIKMYNSVNYGYNAQEGNNGKSNN